MADDNSGYEVTKEPNTTTHSNKMGTEEIQNDKSYTNIQLHGGCGLGGVTIISGSTPKHGDIQSQLKEEGKLKYIKYNCIK